MHDERIQWALNQCLLEDYFLNEAQTYTLEEKKDTGRSELQVHIANENLCVSDFDSKKKCGFFRQESTFGFQKSVDHIIFEKQDTGWVLHLIEMKSTVGAKTWFSIKAKIRTSYFTALALANVLGITIIKVHTYTTFEEEKFTPKSQTVNPATLHHLTGKLAIDPKSDEWDKEKILINVGTQISFPHKAIKMNRSEDNSRLLGALTL